MVIGFGGWGVSAEDLPRTPVELKAAIKDIKQAPGESVPMWYNEFLDLMFENDNWQNVVYDEFVARMSTFGTTKKLYDVLSTIQLRMPLSNITSINPFQTTS